MSEGRWVWCPPGWRVVPEVPTDEMLDAWDDAEIIGDDETVYRAIVATAPEPPGPGDGAGATGALRYWTAAEILDRPLPPDRVAVSAHGASQ